MIAVRRSACSCRRRRRMTSGVPSTPPAWTSSRRRVTADERDGASSMKKSTAAPTDSAIRTRARISTSRLDVDVDDLANPEIPDDLHRRRKPEEEAAERVREHQGAVLRIEQVDDAADDDRQRGQDVAAHPALRRVDAQLTADRKSRADHRREVVEDLGEIAPDLALD